MEAPGRDWSRLVIRTALAMGMVADLALATRSDLHKSYRTSSIKEPFSLGRLNSALERYRRGLFVSVKSCS
jgi:hypothetical protein